MTNFIKSLNANQTFSGTISPLHWYFGVFKQIPISIVRAVSRALKLITQHENS